MILLSLGKNGFLEGPPSLVVNGRVLKWGLSPLVNPNEWLFCGMTQSV